MAPDVDGSSRKFRRFVQRLETSYTRSIPMLLVVPQRRANSIPAVLAGPQASTRRSGGQHYEVAWERYDEYKTIEYTGVAQYKRDELWECSKVFSLRTRNIIYKLYRGYTAADFIARTSVTRTH